MVDSGDAVLVERAPLRRDDLVQRVLPRVPEAEGLAHVQRAVREQRVG